MSDDAKLYAIFMNPCAGSGCSCLGYKITYPHKHGSATRSTTESGAKRFARIHGINWPLRPGQYIGVTK